ncbi:hypothetical protein VitviT2T_014620 [Vitis vinifera]|uniref:Myb-like domain-containing protein n=1 Tax=Vitis vinifera TaxID=29760 RepID=A0ABY9CKC9_VITVI|nr:MYB-like transcription factor ETC1 isoform X1 [Vitis vinifera]WJZ95884.1 hypothetical protein VitviT2T_014620 [Vitis vinifera]
MSPLVRTPKVPTQHPSLSSSCSLIWVCSGSEETAKDSKVEFSEDEETLIARMFRLVGDRWNLIAGRIPGRSAEEIKKYWTSKSVSSSTKQHD